MGSAQQFVVGWLEYVAASALLLLVAKLVVSRLRQPVDRVNLVGMSLVAAAVLPVFLSLIGMPAWRLGLVAGQLPPVAESVEAIPPLATGAAVDSEDEFEKLASATGRAEAIRKESELPRSSSLSQSIAEQDGRTVATVDATLNNLPEGHSLRAMVATPWGLAAVGILLAHGFATSWFSLQWMLGARRLRRIATAAAAPGATAIAAWRQVSSEKGSRVRFLVSADVTVPMVYGWRHPVILLPKAIAEGPSAATQLCLAHEWSHVVRGDLLRWQLVMLCQYLLWYQPLYWLLRRELQLNQDLVADERAIASTDQEWGRIEYSELLVSIASRSQRQGIGGAMAFCDRRPQLSRRINALLSATKTFRNHSTPAFLGGTVLLLFVAAFVVSSVRLGPARANEEQVVQQSVDQSDGMGESTSDTVEAVEGFKSIRGQVVDTKGQPISGAKLWLPLQHEPRRTLEAKTDESGNFEIRCPTDWLSRHRSQRRSTLWAYAPGFSIQTHPVYAALYDTQKQTDKIEMPPENEVRYRVLRPNGQRLAGVIVQARIYKTSIGYEQVPEEVQPHVSARSDERGGVILPAVEDRPLDSVEVIAESYGRQIMPASGKTVRGVRELRLSRAVSIEGKLIAANPSWVGGINITFTTNFPTTFSAPKGIASVVTDEEGCFYVPEIAASGPLRTRVGINPSLPVRPDLSDSIDVRMNQTSELIIPLVPTTRVRGKVVAKETGQPLAGAEIFIGYGKADQMTFVVSDERGEYEASVLPGDVSLHVVASPEGYMQTRFSWDEEYPVSAGAGVVDLPVLELITLRTVSGQLIDEQGEPLAGVRVMAAATRSSLLVGYSMSDESDETGAFQLGLPEETEFSFAVDVKGHRNVPLKVVQQNPLILKFHPPNEKGDGGLFR